MTAGKAERKEKMVALYSRQSATMQITGIHNLTRALPGF